MLGGDEHNQSAEYFRAIQKLSMFVLNRQGSSSSQNTNGEGIIDEGTKNVVRSIFNENVCRLLD